jgi:hypothetical protein
VTWPKEALSFDWYFGNTTTFTVDATWYTGASWARPILDNEGVETTASPEGVYYMMRAYGTGNVVNNIEFTGMAQLHGGTNEYSPSMLQIGTNSGATSGEVKNCYFHGWSHGGTATGDNAAILRAYADEGAGSLYIHHNVFDGSDTTKDMAKAIMAGGHIYNNYIAYLPNAIFASGYVWGNTITEIGTTASFDATMHYNVYECNRGWSIFYNNFIKNTSGGNVLTYSIDGYKDYFFNNVSMGDNGSSFQFGTNNGGQITLVTGVGFEQHTFNNTIQSIEGNGYPPISGPTLTEAAAMPLLSIKNNHLIGPSHTAYCGEEGSYTTCTYSDKVEQTNAQATTANYVSTGDYPYSPPVGGATINSGATIDCAGIGLTDATPSLALTACGYDTTLGVDYNATSHTVTYPKRTAVARSTWDIGAYEYITGTHSGISVSGGVSFR